MERGVHIAGQIARDLRGACHAHERERVHREVRIELELREAVARDETARFQHLVYHLVLNAAERDHRRLVVGQLEDTTEKNRHVFELRPRAGLDFRDHLVREIGVRAAEIEQEFHPHHQTSL